MATYKYRNNETGEITEMPWNGPKPPTERDIDQYNELNASPKVDLGHAEGIGPDEKPWYEQLYDKAKIPFHSALAGTVGDPWKVEAGQDPGGMVGMLEHPIDSLTESITAPFKRDYAGMQEGGLKGIMSATSMAMNTAVPGSAEIPHMLMNIFGKEPESSSEELIGADKYTRDPNADVYNGDNSYLDRGLRGMGNIAGQVMLGKMLGGGEEIPNHPGERMTNMGRTNRIAFEDANAQLDTYKQSPSESTASVPKPKYEPSTEFGDSYHVEFDDHPNLRNPTANPHGPIPDIPVEQIKAIPPKDIDVNPMELPYGDIDFTDPNKPNWAVTENVPEGRPIRPGSRMETLDPDFVIEQPPIDTPPDIQIPREMSMFENLKKNLFSKDLSTQTGAVGDIGPLNNFRKSQFKKYGDDWQIKQTPEEAAFHAKLVKGNASFQTAKPGESGLDVPAQPQIDFKDLEGKIDQTKVNDFLQSVGQAEPKVELPGEAVENVPQVKMPVERPIEKIKDSSIIDPSNDLGLSADDLQNKISSESLQGQEQVSLQDRIAKAQSAEEVMQIKKQTREEMRAQRIAQREEMKAQKQAEKDAILPKEKSPAEDALHGLDVITDLPKGLKGAMDMSWPARQGFMVHTSPDFWKAVKDGSKAITEEGYQSIRKELTEHPLRERAKAAGLNQAIDPEMRVTLNETHPSDVLNKLPGFKQSERVFGAQGDLFRMRYFETLSKKFGPENDVHSAKLANTLTLRRPLPEVVRKAVPGITKMMNKVGFSPSGVWSRVTTPTLFFELPNKMKTEYVRQVGGSLASATALLTATAATLNGMGHDVEVQKDPRHTNFLKLKDNSIAGKPSYDLFGGATGYIRTAARVLTGTSINARGEKTQYKGRSLFGRPLERFGIDSPSDPYPKYGYPIQNQMDEMGSFLEGKESPILSAMSQYHKGTGYGGEKYGAGELFRDLTEPMGESTIRRAAVRYGPESALAGTPDLFGVGVNMEVPEEMQGNDIPEQDKKRGGDGKKNGKSKHRRVGF